MCKAWTAVTIRIVYCHLGSDDTQFGKNVLTFWRNLLSPSSQHILDDGSSGYMYQTPRYHILEDRDLQFVFCLLKYLTL
jgi:hypothetical protein